MYTGIWNPWNEDWFQKRLSGIRNGTAQPMNASSWRSALRMFQNTRTLSLRVSHLSIAVEECHSRTDA